MRNTDVTIQGQLSKLQQFHKNIFTNLGIDIPKGNCEFTSIYSYFRQILFLTSLTELLFILSSKWLFKRKIN